MYFLKVAVVSLRFNAGHVAHLKAYHDLFAKLVDEVVLCIHPKYRSFFAEFPDVIYTTSPEAVLSTSPKIVFMYNVSLHNIVLVCKCKAKRIPSFYVMHEPYTGIQGLIKEGGEMPRSFVRNIVDCAMCVVTDYIVLASMYGKRQYQRHMAFLNRNYDVFPLIFADEYRMNQSYERQYFAFIGAFCDPHDKSTFVRFMEYALTAHLGIRFLIATRTDVSEYLERPLWQQAMVDGDLKVQHGRFMTTEEVNGYYRQSICVWNAYARSTQSGVLPNALMQGTPLILNSNGVSKEVMQDKTAGCYISLQPRNEEILAAYHYIRANLEEMEKMARKIFQEKYFYGAQIELAKKIFLKKE